MSENKNYFDDLVKAGAIKVNKTTPEWAKEVLLNEVKYITKLQKLDSLMIALNRHFTRKFERTAFKDVME